jgi:hypothetical protein
VDSGDGESESKAAGGSTLLRVFERGCNLFSCQCAVIRFLCAVPTTHQFLLTGSSGRVRFQSQCLLAGTVLEIVLSLVTCDGLAPSGST